QQERQVGQRDAAQAEALQRRETLHRRQILPVPDQEEPPEGRQALEEAERERRLRLAEGEPFERGHVRKAGDVGEPVKRDMQAPEGGEMREEIEVEARAAIGVELDLGMPGHDGAGLLQLRRCQRRLELYDAAFRLQGPERIAEPFDECRIAGEIEKASV